MTEKPDKIIDNANRELQEAAEPPMTVEEFVEEVVDEPSIARTAHQYLLDAIEYFGTRTVFEKGEEKERYRFFDDPANNGEHAVLGNTDVLNSFVDDLRIIANSDERMQKIILFNGPTATGKSELKRCLINGLREYSKTEEGKRYTCDWNLSAMTEPGEGLSYGGGGPKRTKVDETEWFQSPVQINPLSVFPRKTREELGKITGDENVPVDVGLDPFSQEAYDTLKRHYEQQGSEELFSEITADSHFRVRRYVVDETQGIGILTAEDDGSVKERLIGAWMPSMFQMLDSRGRKNPQAFSYDGVLSQGNGGVTVVEDATRHADILVHLLNIPDEEHAKIDKQLGFDVDTVPIFISNPDLVDQQLGEVQEQAIPLEKIHGVDPLKAIKRRLFQYEVRYLTSLQDEVELVRKETAGHLAESEHDSINIRDPLRIDETEFAPHVIEGVALYNVVTRLSDVKEDDVNLVEKALLFDRGYIETEQGRKTIDEFDLEDSPDDGTFGIPVTYTRDILRALVHSSDETLYLPDDVLETIVDGLSDAPVFADTEQKQFEDRVEQVREYINDQQEKDIIKAILADRQASENAITEYIDNLYAWDEDSDEYDELLMKEFEKTHLGTTDADYKGSSLSDNVLDLRRDRLIKPLNNHLWGQRNEEFEVTDIEFKDAPVISALLESYDWADVFSTYPNLNPINWEHPSDETPTAEVKDQCIENLVEKFDYSEESARKTSERVFKHNQDKIIEIRDGVVDSN